MAGMPPPPDSAGRGRGMTLPPWMSGANPPNSLSISAAAPTSTGFRPPASGQLGQQFLTPNSQQFRQGIGPPPSMGTQFSQMTQRPNQHVAFNQQQRPATGPPQPSSNAIGVTPPVVVGVTPPFQFASSAPFSQPNFGVTPAPFQASGPPQSVQSMQANAQAWPGMSSQPNASVPPSISQNSQPNNAASNMGTGGAAAVTRSPSSNASDWQEHSAPDGRRYYYNRKTKVSSWEKPAELMTPTERADASTVWKEFTTSDGRKYYYNKLNKQSKWTMPEEMKLAREKLESSASPSLTQGTEATHVAVISSAKSPSPSLIAASSPASITQSQVPPSVLSKMDVEANVALETTSPAVATPTAVLTDTSTVNTNAEINSNPDKEGEPGEALSQDIEKQTLTTEKSNASAGEDNSLPTDEDQPVYSSKTEAKNVFKELLEAKNVGSDWSWEQAMRVIVNDKRYGALKILGERKQTFNEYVAQKKKQEVEEKRLRQKKAREEFAVMLQECKELTSTMRWSKAAGLFAEDPRFTAVEKERERAELYEDYLHDLEKKEREQAREDRKKYLAEYKAFLETCDFIKATTQWRKVVDKLEDDERCSRLEKIDRLEIFQEHIKELEKQEEEEKKVQKEQQRRKERKNRDGFRKLLADHRASGVLNARTIWKDYVQKIKEDPAYEAVCTNLTGSTPKDLFEDFMEDLEKKYQEDKMMLKEAIKDAKINVTSTSTFDMFKDALADAVKQLSSQGDKDLWVYGTSGSKIRADLSVEKVVEPGILGSLCLSIILAYMLFRGQAW